MSLTPFLKRLIITGDQALTGGVGIRAIRRRRGIALQSRICHRSGLARFGVGHPPETFATFSRLCDRYGSDKGTRSPGPHPYGHSPHSYADFYACLFDHCRNSIRKVFECGLGTNDPLVPSNMGVNGRPGASLRAWRDYFPNARIYGADIDRNVLFTDDRIRTFHVDQTCRESIAELWRHEDLFDFDLIVDDGLHTFEAGITFFEASHAKLRPGGIYIIEDVTLLTLVRFADYFVGTPHQVSYVTLVPEGRGFSESNLVMIRRGDGILA